MLENKETLKLEDDEISTLESIDFSTLTKDIKGIVENTSDTEWKELKTELAAMKNTDI